MSISVIAILTLQAVHRKNNLKKVSILWMNK
jgi:hypothetical protein